MRGEHYVPPTDGQRALIAKTPYDRIAAAFAIVVPLRRYINYLACWARPAIDKPAFLARPDDT